MSKSRKKLYPLPRDFFVRFDQYARGQETPYLLGAILQDNKEVGHFENGGTGGPTIIGPSDIRTAFAEIVAAAQSACGYPTLFEFEQETILIDYALHLKNHPRDPCSFLDYVKALIQAELDYRRTLIP